MQQEIWRDIPNYEGYQVSNQGRVRSISRIVKRGNNLMSIKGVILKPTMSAGYYSVNLRRNGKTKSVKIHRLVALAFIPNPNKYKEIDHINTIRTDNTIENLRWASRLMNSLNPISLSKMKASKRTKEVHGDRKIACYNKDEVLIKIYNNIDEVAEELNLNIYKIRRCLLQKKDGKYSVRTVGGFIWKYL